jgi:hypothetical protein
MMMRNYLLLLLFTLGLGACASTVKVQVNAINNPAEPSPGKNYYMHNAQEANGDNELFFREFSIYFQHALKAKGYRRVEDRKAADFIINMSYGVSPGRTGIETYSWPIYETVGGETITYTQTKTDTTGTKTTTKGSVSVPLRVQRVGTQVESHSYTVYTHHVILEAHSLIHNDGKTKQGPLLWKVIVNRVTESTDLRESMPYMAAAAAPYLGGNTGRQKTITLKPDTPSVQEMRSLIPTKPAQKPESK